MRAGYTRVKPQGCREFAQPVWRTGFSDRRTLIFAPKVYGYLEKSHNPDIQRYRGYAGWNLRYSREDDWLLATQLHNGTSGHGSTQFDLSYPLRKPLFARTGGFRHFQLIKGGMVKVCSTTAWTVGHK